MVNERSIEMQVVLQPFERILQSNNNLQSRFRVLSRVFNGWRYGRDGIRKDIMAHDLLRAENMILVYGMIHTAEALEKGPGPSLPIPIYYIHFMNI